jgi:hypothetical protein
MPVIGVKWETANALLCEVALTWHMAGYLEWNQREAMIGAWNRLGPFQSGSPPLSQGLRGWLLLPARPDEIAIKLIYSTLPPASKV